VEIHARARSRPGALGGFSAVRACYTKQLPDLAVWLKRSDPPVALVAESGGRPDDRQKMILEAWRDAIAARRYPGVRYDCTNQSVARWITRLAKKVWLTAPAFAAAVQPNAEEIAPSLPPPTPAMRCPTASLSHHPNPRRPETCRPRSHRFARRHSERHCRSPRQAGPAAPNPRGRG
jgi:hypothetical protein